MFINQLQNMPLASLLHSHCLNPSPYLSITTRSKHKHNLSLQIPKPLSLDFTTPGTHSLSARILPVATPRTQEVWTCLPSITQSWLLYMRKNISSILGDE